MTEVLTTTVASGGGVGGKYMIGKRQQVFPVTTRLGAEYNEEPISERLIGAAQTDDLRRAAELVSHPSVDVNFIGTVCLKSRKTEVVLNGESASEVRVEFEEFRTDVTALFLAAHNGNAALLRKLLNAGANVNQKLFRGYATTAAVREGHIKVVEILLNGGAAQAACEEALLEACYLGRSAAADLLMASDMIRPHVAVHALVVASTRGCLDTVKMLVKNGVDGNAVTRLLLQSSKPSLHANVDCNSLAAAVVSRQTSIVQLLLKMGCRTESKVRLGAWSWDVATGEEFRVGAGLAEPYHITWCAVEYYEATGAILRMLLQHSSPNLPHLGRTVLHHAILCGNARAFEVLLSCGADIEFPIQTSQNVDLLRPIHLAARLGSAPILRLLINAGCDLNSRTGYGETALMICARHKHEECFKLLASAGSDFGLSDASNHSAASIAGLSKWNLGFQNAVLEVIRAGNIARSSKPEVFSSLLFVTKANDVEALTKLIKHQDLQNIDERDDLGFSAVMVAAAGGHVEIFRLLVNAGADLEAQNKYGETAITLAKGSQKRDAFAEILSMKGDIKYSLHNAARFGNQDLVQELVSNGFDVNLLDCDGYTPLMYAARSNDGSMCKLLISLGARCGIKNSRHETAVLLAKGDEAENAILDEVARELVIGGCRVKKHTKMGKGAPHLKMLRMVEGGGVLSWGKSSRRNVICRGAEVGPSSTFRWNRRRKNGGGDEGGLFRVVTTKNQEFHFSCCGGVELAELWVRGIRLVTREAIFGRN